MHPHEAVGENAAAEEAPELSFDEAENDAFTRVYPGQEGLELRLNDL